MKKNKTEQVVKGAEEITAKDILDGLFSDGVGASYCICGDAYPYTVVRFEVSKSGLTAKMFVKPCDYRYIGEKKLTYGDQPHHDQYEYTTQEDAQEQEVKLGVKKSGRWVVGYRSYKRDPHV